VLSFGAGRKFKMEILLRNLYFRAWRAAERRAIQAVHGGKS
jgi:hypothetical protein